jgi:hypothetical protein
MAATLLVLSAIAADNRPALACVYLEDDRGVPSGLGWCAPEWAQTWAQTAAGLDFRCEVLEQDSEVGKSSQKSTSGTVWEDLQ